MYPLGHIKLTEECFKTESEEKKKKKSYSKTKFLSDSFYSRDFDQ